MLYKSLLASSRRNSTLQLFTNALLLVLLSLSLLPNRADAFVDRAVRKIGTDFRALTQRVTARHILLPDERVARVLKQKIRDECVEKDMWVVDAFESAAKKFSRDANTNFQGGLIGELVPQGYCKSQELDRLQFSASLGNIVGPVETENGYHLMLISERTNCPALDGDKTRIVRTRKADVFGTLRSAEPVDLSDTIGGVIDDQLRFWTVATVATGILLELT
eukprot:CAMPEP_0197181382 /NCGR_PEP_ID=MMETSP1423-20130617/5691_1 /TAXON_ID=476441 /ORGANISM="Pseudo-nitzschia heimii, Strain UNC1101" /LENGTH=220 /DNA_ID=CAMNT_0042631623 /DNA_START=155 /DNA_END=813 /DNA_ORIENTATION=-